MNEETISLANIREALEGDEPGGILGLVPGLRRAAVALVLRPGASADTELLLIRRAEREGDPWSGQVGLPGGRLDARDGGCVRRAAVRETREEVGVDLERSGRRLGALPEQQAIGRGVRLPMIISPQVYALEKEVVLRPDPREVAACFWVRLGELASGRFDETYWWKVPRAAGVRIPLPSWRYGDHRIWGLTYRMVRSLLDRVRRRTAAGGERR